MAIEAVVRLTDTAFKWDHVHERTLKEPLASRILCTGIDCSWSHTTIYILCSQKLVPAPPTSSRVPKVLLEPLQVTKSVPKNN